jgi:hypothetical protein
MLTFKHGLSWAKPTQSFRIGRQPVCGYGSKTCEPRNQGTFAVRRAPCAPRVSFPVSAGGPRTKGYIDCTLTQALARKHQSGNPSSHTRRCCRCPAPAAHLGLPTPSPSQSSLYSGASARVPRRRMCARLFDNLDRRYRTRLRPHVVEDDRGVPRRHPWRRRKPEEGAG